jgi:hypothetical protein
VNGGDRRRSEGTLPELDALLELPGLAGAFTDVAAIIG